MPRVVAVGEQAEHEEAEQDDQQYSLDPSLGDQELAPSGGLRRGSSSVDPERRGLRDVNGERLSTASAGDCPPALDAD
jgi:hypothetical protein